MRVFEQSIPVWNRLTYPTYVGIQYWHKSYSLGISIFYIHCTAFFEQSVPVWNRLTYPTYVGIHYRQKSYSLGISISYIHRVMNILCGAVVVGGEG